MLEELYDIINSPINNVKEFLQCVYEVIKVSDEINIEFIDSKKNYGAYVPTKKAIVINELVLNELIAKKIKSDLNCDSPELIKLCAKLELISVMIHENTHAKQDLISEGKISTEHSFYDQACKDVFRVAMKNIIIHYYYKRYVYYDMFFEREAYLNGSRNAQSLAMMLGSSELYDYYEIEVLFYLLTGYYKKSLKDTLLRKKPKETQLTTDGAIKLSYKDFFMEHAYEKLDIPNNMSIDEKINFGLEVPEEELIEYFQNLSSNSNGKLRRNFHFEYKEKRRLYK